MCLNRALWLSLVVIGAYSSSQCVVQEFESFWWQFTPSDTQWCAKFGRWENSNDAILEHSGTFSQVSRQHPQDRSQNCNGQCPDMSPTYPNFCGNFEQTLFDTAGNSLPKHIQKASFFLILHNGIISLGSEKFTGDISYDYIYIQCLKLISVDLSSGRPLSEGVMVSEGVPVHCSKRQNIEESVMSPHNNLNRTRCGIQFYFHCRRWQIGSWEHRHWESHCNLYVIGDVTIQGPSVKKVKQHNIPAFSSPMAIFEMFWFRTITCPRGTLVSESWVMIKWVTFSKAIPRVDTYVQLPLESPIRIFFNQRWSSVHCTIAPCDEPTSAPLAESRSTTFPSLNTLPAC